MNDRRKQKSLVATGRWAAYAAAGAASAVAGEQAAEAAITHVTVGQVVNDSFHSFNLTGGVSISFGHTDLGAGDGVAYVDMFGGGAIAGFNGGFYNYASNIAAGANVNTLPSFLPNNTLGTMAFRGGYGNDEFLAPGVGFIAFRFDAGGGNQYGWARVIMDGAPFNSFTLVDYAFAGVGESINAGQTVVPAPGALAFLALGATGLTGWRRKRAAA